MPPAKTTPFPAKEPRRTADLPAIAFEYLKQAILNGELPEGTRVRESRLASEWKIGVTPLREAVRRMAALGYLVLEPNHAPLVRKLSSGDIRQIYELREMLECFALRGAWNAIDGKALAGLHNLVAKIERTPAAGNRLRAQFALDSQLHQLWISQPSNPWLTSSLERLLIYRPNLMNVIAKHQEFAEKAFAEHKQILAALERRDLEKAVKLLARHIQESGSVLAALTRQETTATLP